jgi:hypothetical protein
VAFIIVNVEKLGWQLAYVWLIKADGAICARLHLAAAVAEGNQPNRVLFSRMVG